MPFGLPKQRLTHTHKQTNHNLPNPNHASNLFHALRGRCLGLSRPQRKGMPTVSQNSRPLTAALVGNGALSQTTNSGTKRSARRKSQGTEPHVAGASGVVEVRLGATCNRQFGTTARSCATFASICRRCPARAHGGTVSITNACTDLAWHLFVGSWCLLPKIGAPWLPRYRRGSKFTQGSAANGLGQDASSHSPIEM